MRHPWVSVFILIAVLTAGCCIEKSTTTRAGDDEQGFISLFDGASAEGWKVYLEKEGPIDPEAFYIQDGAIACKGQGWFWYRYEARKFDNFVLRLEFKVAKDTNSGVCLRTLEKGPPPTTGFEIQIADDFGKDAHKHSTGAIYDVVTPMYNASKPAGEWNEMEVTCDGQLVKVVLNGLKIIDTDFSKLTKPLGKFPTPYAELPKTGYIALQDHWTPVWYRNIRIKPLP